MFSFFLEKKINGDSTFVAIMHIILKIKIKLF